MFKQGDILILTNGKNKFAEPGSKAEVTRDQTGEMVLVEWITNIHKGTQIQKPDPYSGVLWQNDGDYYSGDFVLESQNNYQIF